MIGTIIGAVVIGLIIGALARLDAGQAEHRRHHDHRARRCGVTDRYVAHLQLGYSNENGGFKIIPFLVGIIVAVVLIAAYLGITGRRRTVR